MESERGKILCGWVRKMEQCVLLLLLSTPTKQHSQNSTHSPGPKKWKKKFSLLSLPSFFKLRCSPFFLLCRSWTFISPAFFLLASSAGNKSIREGERREATYGLKGIPYFNSTSPPPLLPGWQAKMFRPSVSTHRAKQMKPCAEDFSEYTY